MKKILLLFIITIFVVGLVSADLFQFDNVITSYNSTAKEVTINNFFGAGGVISKIILTDNSDFCSQKCFASGTIYLPGGGKLLDNMNFKTFLPNNGWVGSNINYQVFIQNGTQKKIISNNNCSVVGKHLELNGSLTDITNCVVSQNTIDVPAYILYDNSNLPSGTYNWRIEGTKPVNSDVDWIGTWDGVQVTQWAGWNSTFNIGLMSYYNFNEPNGTVLFDSLGKHNGTTNGATPNHQGIIGTSWNFIKGSGNYIGLSGNFNLTSQPLTFNIWVNHTDLTTPTQYYMSGSSGGYTFYTSTSNGHVHFGQEDISDLEFTNTNIGAASWHMITATYNDSGVSIYVDGAYKQTLGYTQTAANTPYNFGAYEQSASFLNANLDEVGIWNRSLSSNEITSLYNGGAGITYSAGQTSVSLISPGNASKFSNGNVLFNCSATAVANGPIKNVSLYINSVLNFTVVDGVNNLTFLSTTVPLLDGNYNWTCSGTDILSTIYAPLNYTFDIDTIAPIVTIANPLNQTYSFGYITNGSVSIGLNASYSDTHLSNCWIYNGTANVSITCGQNLSITTGFNSYNFIFYANDTFGNIGSSNVSATWNYILLQNNLTYNNQSISGSNENYKLNITINNPSQYSGIITYVNYNNTNYSGSSSDTGANKMFTSSIVSPVVPSQKNFTIYWIIELTNSSRVFDYYSEIGRAHV
jgi:hypothetical protein